MHAATYGSGSAIYGIAENDNGYAATFESENSFPTLNSTNYENGNAGKFEINNINSTGHTLLVNTNGLGRGGWFQSTNPLNNAASIISENHGSGQAIYGTNLGTGKAGVFEINNGSNSSFALHAFTNGTGKAAYFQGTNALETNGTIKFGGAGVGTISAGKVLTSDAVGNATWQDVPAVVAPLNLTHTVTLFNQLRLEQLGMQVVFKLLMPQIQQMHLLQIQVGQAKLPTFKAQMPLKPMALLNSEALASVLLLLEKY
ncbi:MAG: hypothetical protein IPO04_00575 [Cytophagaceae bacterium]|nr:hypothetical protein [Cytophagaceae bacterium]